MALRAQPKHLWMAGLMGRPQKAECAWTVAQTEFGWRNARQSRGATASEGSAGWLGLRWIDDRIGPGVSAGFAEPVVRGFNGFESRIFGFAFGASGDFVLWRGFVRLYLVDDGLRDGLGCNRACLIELIGGNVDLNVTRTVLIDPRNGKPCARSLNPALDSGTAQHFRALRSLLQ